MQIANAMLYAERRLWNDVNWHREPRNRLRICYTRTFLLYKSSGQSAPRRFQGRASVKESKIRKNVAEKDNCKLITRSFQLISFLKSFSFLCSLPLYHPVPAPPSSAVYTSDCVCCRQECRVAIPDNKPTNAFAHTQIHVYLHTRQNR